MPAVGIPTIVEPPQPPPPKYELPALTVSRGSDVIHLPFTANDPGHIWCIGPGIEGLDQPTTELLQQRAASQFGSYARGVDVPAREIFLPLMVMAPTYTQMLELRDQWNMLTSPYHGKSTLLTLTRPDGSQRWIEGFRVGNAPTWDLSNWIPRISWQRFGQTFVCPDPWWHGSPITETWSGDAGQFFFPITPVHLAPDRILGQPRVINVKGDVIAYPFFEICGPSTSVTATHVESGRSWTLDAVLEGPTTGNPEAECATVNTDPRAAALGPPIQGPNGENWFEYMEPPYDLWSLPTGDQTIQIDVEGSNDDTRVSVRIVSLWETS